MDSKLLESVRGEVKAHGWAVHHGISASTPYPYAHTVGLCQYAVPEIIVFGIGEPRESAALLHRLARRAVHAVFGSHSSYPLVPGNVLCDMYEGGYPLSVIEAEDSTEFLAMANMLFGDTEPVKAVQLVLPDSERRWPWNHDSDVHYDMPVLGPVPLHLQQSH